MANTSFTPTWKSFEKDLNSDNPTKQKKAEDGFITERAKELQASSKAKHWEADRKAGWAKDKHEYVVKKKQAETAPIEKLKKDLKTGGNFDVGLQPMPGYVLVQLDKKEEQTEAGIFLTDASLEDILNSNTGTVITIGEKIVNYIEVVNPPCSPGDRVLIKKGLPGLELTIKGELMLLMTWGDILGVFDA